jgi:proline iminopeptidase
MKTNFSIIITLAAAVFFLTGCQHEYFTQSGIAEDHFFLRSGNQHMPVTVAGNVDSKKFLVIIHGGPGGNGLEYRDTYVRTEVEKEAAVVYWDQRFAGNTQGNGGDPYITAFRQDIKNLLLILKAKYGSDNDFHLFAHSWGGFLAPYFLTDGENQNMVKSWIQIGGAHNYRMNDSLTLEMLIHYGDIELEAGNNVAEWEEIVEWCKANGFEGKENTSMLNNFAHKAEGLIYDIFEPEPDNPHQRPAKLSHWSNGISSSMLEIDGPAYYTPISDQLFKIQIPTLLLWGKYDFVCPPELADDIEENIGSTDVSKIIYNHSGHSPMMNQPEEFWNDVLNWLKLH